MANEHYVNNAEFLAAMIEFRKDVVEASETDSESPQVPPYIGECIYKIATHLSYKPCFIGYSFRDDMVFDGIENCLRYIKNFDPAKSSNPFSYFTQIIYFAFLRCISKEKKQSHIKHRIILEAPFEFFELQEQDEDGEYSNQFLEMLQTAQAQKQYMPPTERAVKKPKKSKDKLDLFMGDEENV